MPRVPWFALSFIGFVFTAAACTESSDDTPDPAIVRGSAGASSSAGAGAGAGGTASSGAGAGGAGEAGSNGTAGSGGSNASAGGAGGSVGAGSGGAGAAAGVGGAPAAGTGGAAAGVGGSGAAGSGGGAGGAGGGDAGMGGSAIGNDDPWEAGRQQCVDTINEYRKTVGKPPLARWTEAEDCVDAQAANDAASGVAHQGFQTIGGCGMGQNECPGYASIPSGLDQCLAQMWAEGPTPDGTWDVAHGHYMNMFGDYTYMGFQQHFTKVACGFAKAANGGVWSVQNFQ